MANTFQNFRINQIKCNNPFIGFQVLKTGKNIISRMTKQYESMNHGRFYKWVEQFKNGRTLVTDESLSGRAIVVSTPERVIQIDSLIGENRL